MSKAKIEVHCKVRVELKNGFVFGKIVEVSDSDLFYLETAKGERYKFYADIVDVFTMSEIEIVQYYLDQHGYEYDGFSGSDYDHLYVKGDKYNVNVTIETHDGEITYSFYTTNNERLQREYEKVSWEQETSKADGNFMTRKSVGALTELALKWLEK